MAVCFNLRSAADAQVTAQEVLGVIPHARVFALQGELGAGKTTLIKGFCAALGVTDQASSPSFAIVNEYRAASGEPVYHFDLYRLKDAHELEGIGFTEYVDSGHYCFIEWPELAEGMLPPGTVHLKLTETVDGTRTIALDEGA
jgi:tRNA threonylcarbamoyladenosine biosynthesis protein TsaE